MLTKAMITFLISMIPVVELRGAIPYGILTAGLKPWLVFALAVVGNMIPVPFILLFIRRIFAWMKRFPKMAKLAEKFEAKAAKKSGRVKKSETIGLCLLVAIPLPGTGAWTGALVAALMNMRIKRALPTIFVGVLIAAVAVTLIVTLGIHALDFLTG